MLLFVISGVVDLVLEEQALYMAYQGEVVYWRKNKNLAYIISHNIHYF